MPFKQEEPMRVEPNFTVWVDDEALLAEVRNKQGKVVKKFRGETAWSGAARYAGDFENSMELPD